MSNCNFHALTDNYFQKSQIEEIILEKDNYLFREDEGLDHIYFLCSGELNISQNEFFLWQAQKNEFIGITSYFRGESKYSTTIKAFQNSKLYKIPLLEFKTALEKHHKLNSYLMKLFCERIEKTFSKGEDSIKFSRKNRLINMMLMKAEKVINKEGMVLRYSCSELAQMVNVSNRFAKQLFDELQFRKLIKIKKNLIEITDFNGLKIVSKMKGVMD